MTTVAKNGNKISSKIGIQDKEKCCTKYIAFKQFVKNEKRPPGYLSTDAFLALGDFTIA